MAEKKRWNVAGLVDPEEVAEPDEMVESDALIGDGQVAAANEEPEEEETEQGQETPQPQPEPGSRPEESQLEARLRALDEENRQYRERFARLEERHRIIQEANEAQRRQEEEAAQAEQRKALLAQRPDETIDPYGARLWDAEQETRQLREQVANLTSQRQQETQLTEQQRAVKTVWDTLNADVATFSKVKPDTQAAMDYLIETRRKELSNPELGLDVNAVNNLINSEAFYYTRLAMQNGKSPAQFFYNVAMQRGYQPAQAQPPATSGKPGIPPLVPQANGNPRPAAAQPVNQGQQKMQAVKKGQAMQGLGKAPAATGNNELSFEEIDQMSDDDFARLYNTSQRHANYINGLIEGQW